NTSPSSLSAFRKAIGSATYQSNIYATLDQEPIPAPEQVVLPPPPSAALPAVSISKSYWIGPGAGQVQIVDVRNGTPQPHATLVYHGDVAIKTDASGQATMPTRNSHPTLEQIVVGTTIIPTRLVLDSSNGYLVQVDLAKGRIAHVVVYLINITWPT